MSIKRLLAVLLVVMITASLLAGCGSSNSKPADQTKSAAETKTEESKPAEKKEVVLYMTDIIKDKDVQAGFFKDFEEANNATVKAIIQPSDKFVQNFMVAINGGQRMDTIVLNGQDVRTFSKKGLIADITNDVTFMDRFQTAAADQFKIDGKLFGVPTYSPFTSGLFYNKELFAKYNLQVPKTLDELKNVVKTLNDNGIAGFGFGGASIYMWPMWYFEIFSQTSMNNGEQRTFDTLTGKAKFTDADYIEAMDIFAQYAKANLWQKGFNGADSAAGAATFVSGRAGMFFGGTWEIDGFVKGGMDDSKLGMAQWPVVKAGAKPEHCGGPGGGASCINAQIDPANKEIAIKLIDYLTDDKSNHKMLEINNAYLTPNKNVKREGGPAVNDIVNKELVPSTVTFLDWYWPSEITKAFQTEMQAVAGQKEDAKTAMEKIQKVMDDLIAKGYDFNAVK